MPPPPTPLQSTWTTLYKHTLPTLARSHSPSQPHWPVHLDHCFARTILDAVIGSPTASPWTACLKSPAIHNMSVRQLEECIKLGEDIKEGRVDLVELDRRSLEVRGKVKRVGGRKRGGEEGGASAAAAAASKRRKMQLNDGRAESAVGGGVKKPKSTRRQAWKRPPHAPSIDGDEDVADER